MSFARAGLSKPSSSSEINKNYFFVILVKFNLDSGSESATTSTKSFKPSDKLNPKTVDFVR